MDVGSAGNTGAIFQRDPFEGSMILYYVHMLKAACSVPMKYPGQTKIAKVSRLSMMKTKLKLCTIEAVVRCGNSVAEPCTRRPL